MTIPILGQAPEGICLLCHGRLTPEHEHVYVDKTELFLMNSVFEEVLKNECILITDKGLIPAHPPVGGGYEWFPVNLNYAGKHDECIMPFPHHHCEVPNGIVPDTD
jgi:hypothetical protein